jgi:hypothetical protein
MQEQNFEKQVRQKMEELSLTPSEPVWKKVELQIREKRDRRRLLFWLPLTALLLTGGIWHISNNLNNNYADSKTAKQENDKINTISPIEQKVTVQKLQEPSSEKEQSVIANKNLQQENKIPFGSKPKALPSQEVNNNQLRSAKAHTITAKHTQPGIEINEKNHDKPTTETNSQGVSVTGKEELSNVSKNKDELALIKESPKGDSIVSQGKVEPADAIATDTTIIKPETKITEKDSASIKNNIAKAGKNFSAKWKLAIIGYFGRSGVSNGLGLFGGGAKSLETNAFADRTNYASMSQPNSNNPGSTYRPPSAQNKSTSFSLGMLIKKQMSKRIVLSTGLQYNFYSTQMQVGQSVNRDTMVDRNKSVNSFYTNSGNDFREYKNKFHFISLPIGFDFQLLKNLPLDFHLGLSLHQLMKTNALLYSSFSQVYYDDKDAFNKTLLFSEIGLDYSVPLTKNLSLKAGPRANYSHTGAIKGSSSQHLFSYGIATQFIFSGK